MGMIIDVFARYSGAEGNKQSLTKGELKVLMEKELPGFLQVRAQGPGGQDGGSPWGRASLVLVQEEGQGRQWGGGKEGHGRQKGQKGSGPNCSKGERQ